MDQTATLQTNLPRRGLMFILSSPSGAGKTTIAHKLLEAEGAKLAMSVSVTTRPIRPGEVEGRDYFFTDEASFRAKVADGEFLEWAEVFGNLYGTPRGHVSAGLAAGQDFLFDVDWQGAQQLSQGAGADVVSVFLLPPSIAELEHRLRSRGTDSDTVIQGRMDRAKAEISHWDGYDYVVVNDDIAACFERVHILLQAERLRRQRQTGLIDFARELMR